MTLKQVADMIASVGYPYAYYQFEPDPDNPPPAPPFICFWYPGDNDMLADNSNYTRINRLVVELYCDQKDFTAEAAVEAKLAANGMVWGKTEQYINSEHMHMTTYTMGVIING